jgi:hypothetical protein
MYSVLQEITGVKMNIIPGAKTAGRAAMLREGTVVLSWFTALDTLVGLRGTEDFEQWGPQSLRVIYLGGFLDQGLAVRANSGIKTLLDLRGKKVAEYPTYPTVQMYMDAVMAFSGLSWDEVEATPISSYAAGQTAIVEGAVDTAVMSGTSATAFELEASIHGIHWLPMPATDTEGWKRYHEVLPVFYPNRSTIVAGASKANPVDIWGYNYHVLCYDWQDEDLVYWLTKIHVEGYDTYKGAHAYLRKWTLDHALDYNLWYCPWHEGAIRYFKDIGRWTPAMEAKNQENLARWPQTMTKP